MSLSNPYADGGGSLPDLPYWLSDYLEDGDGSMRWRFANNFTDNFTNGNCSINAKTMRLVGGWSGGYLSLFVYLAVDVVHGGTWLLWDWYDFLSMTWLVMPHICSTRRAQANVICLMCSARVRVIRLCTEPLLPHLSMLYPCTCYQASYIWLKYGLSLHFEVNCLALEKTCTYPCNY